jgi:excinuclease UvrABC nuclease subunit
MTMESLEMYEAIVARYLKRLKEVLGQPPKNFADDSSDDVPKKPGVYVIYNKKSQQIIYAGRTKNLRRRLLGDHRRGNIEGSQFRKALGQSLRTSSEKEIRKYIEENCSFRFLVVENFEEMVRLEHFVTAVIAPTLNVQLKQ